MPDLDTRRLSEPLPHVWLVQLHRPQARNALNTQMGRDLRTLFGPLQFTPGSLRCIVITGEGDKAFCAGGDLKERQGMSDADWKLQHAIFEEAFYAVLDCSVPVVAAVIGAAFGGGCELSLMCDFIYAADHARFALPEVGLGIIPGCGGTQTLARAVGGRRAKALVLTGTPFDAHQAHLWGMVNQVCPAGALLSAALSMRPAHCRQRTAFGAPSQKSHPPRFARRLAKRLELRGGGLPAPDPHPRPARGHAGLQRKTQTPLHGRLNCQGGIGLASCHSPKRAWRACCSAWS